MTLCCELAKPKVLGSNLQYQSFYSISTNPNAHGLSGSLRRRQGLNATLPATNIDDLERCSLRHLPVKKAPKPPQVKRLSPDEEDLREHKFLRKIFETSLVIDILKNDGSRLYPLNHANGEIRRTLRIAVNLHEFA